MVAYSLIRLFAYLAQLTPPINEGLRDPVKSTKSPENTGVHHDRVFRGELGRSLVPKCFRPATRFRWIPADGAKVSPEPRLTCHLCSDSSQRGGWGIRTPEGVNPTRFPSVRHRPLGESSRHYSVTPPRSGEHKRRLSSSNGGHR